MAGFFYLSGRELGGGGGATTASSSSKQEDQEKEENVHNLFLYRSNEEIYNSNKGFEIWPQSYYHQHQQQLSGSNYASFGLVGPSRRSSFSMSDDSSPRSGFHAMRQGGNIGGGGGGMNCQDCGNQAKKDCVHLRCRTCCRSRGFQCQTHVKSTWVPAAKRRERLQQLSALQQQQQQQQQFRGENPKRLRENQSLIACTTATTRLSTGTSGLEVGQFPQEVNSPALFRCVQVSAMDDADNQLAYQTAVNIGGHVFRGILYDQGPDARYSGLGESSSGGSQQVNLLTAAATRATAATSAPTGALIDPSSLYPPPLNAFVAGTQFFPPPRP